MSTCSRCGADAGSGSKASALCPACLLRLGLEAADSAAGLDVTGLRVIAPVGRGPDATVYLAQAMRGERRLVTVKLYNERVDAPRFVSRVRDLAFRIQACDAAASLTILDAGSLETSRVFVVARYVPGTSLDAYFRATARRRHDALSLVARVCGLVSRIHRAGIVHGGIKPSNVIVTPAPEGPEPMLLDAGLRSALEFSRRAGLLPDSQDPARPGADYRTDIAGLRALATDLFAYRPVADDAAELMETLARREFETASELAEEAAALASRASS